MDKERINKRRNSHKYPEKAIISKKDFSNLKSTIHNETNKPQTKKPKLVLGRGTTKEYLVDDESSDEEKKKALEEVNKLKQEIILDQYVMMVELGKGSFGQIFLAFKVGDNEEVAVKKEIKKFNNHRPLNPTVKTEFNVYKALLKFGYENTNNTDFVIDCSGAIGIVQDEVLGLPKFYGYGEHEDYFYLIIELLGPNLIELFHYCGSKRFSLPTVCMLALQMLNRIEYVHKHHYLHRDIKPENFLIGCGDKSNILHLIDFGLSKKYKDPKTHQHIQYREGRSITGTVRYVSINTHLGVEQSRRDDLESIGYVLIMFLKGSLPWQGMRLKEDKYNKIMEKKLQIPTEILCLGLQDEFTHYLSYCKSLRFDDRPDYEYLKGLFSNLLNNTINTISIGKESLKFDWCFEDMKTAFEFYSTNKKKDPMKTNSITSGENYYYPDSSNTLNEGVKNNNNFSSFQNLAPIKENLCDRSLEAPIKEPTNNAIFCNDSEEDSQKSANNSDRTISVNHILKEGISNRLNYLLKEKGNVEREEIDDYVDIMLRKHNFKVKSRREVENSYNSSDLTPEITTNQNRNLHSAMNLISQTKNEFDNSEIDRSHSRNQNNMDISKYELQDANRRTSIEKIISSNFSNKLKDRTTSKIQKISDIICNQSLIDVLGSNIKLIELDRSHYTNSSNNDLLNSNISSKFSRIKSFTETKDINQSKLGVVHNSPISSANNLNSSMMANNLAKQLKSPSRTDKLTIENPDSPQMKKHKNNLLNIKTKEDTQLKNFKLEFSMLSNSPSQNNINLTNVPDSDLNMSTILKFSKNQIITISKEPVTKHYKIISDLGSGSLGTVKKVLHKKLNEERAMKIIEKKKVEMSEIEILKKISHPNIISIYEIYEDNKNFNIITEYLEGGELFEMIASQVNFSEVEAAHIMKQIIGSLVYLHNKGIAHRDLKPENIMLVTKKNSNFSIKLIDFSTAKQIDKNEKLTKFVGTSYYVAPEVLGESYDEKCDVWSCGVILYILLCGYPPFNGSTNHEIYNAIKKNNPSFPPEEWKDISKDAVDLIKQMLNKDVPKRFSAFKCLNHKWFKQLEKKDKNSIENNKQLSINVIKKMSEFVQQNKLKQAILQFISTHFNIKVEEDELRKVFAEFDPLGKGIISKADFQSSLENLFGESEAERLTEAIFQDIDLDGSGEISYDEFVTSIIDARKVLTNGQLEIAFKMLDKDGSGSISLEEICNVFGGNMTAWKDIINEVDLNGDGEIDFEEFKYMMCGMDKNLLVSN